MANVPLSMTIFVCSYLFFSGACLGSFLMLVGQRVPQKLSIKGRSHCSKCQSQLKWFDLIPIFSYVFLKGACRQCRTKISKAYLFVEIVSGSFFLTVPFLLEMSLETIIGLTLFCLLLVITVSDVYYQLIPNKILWPFLLIGLFERIIIQPLSPWWFAFLGGAVGFGTLLLIALLSKGGMGGGDVKLFGVIGIFLGPIYVLVAFFGASVLALVYSIIKMAITKTKIKHVPLGPFIAIATWLTYMVVSDQFGGLVRLLYFR